MVPSALSNFEAALLDDLSMPRAAASLFALIKAAEKEFKRHTQNPDSQLDEAGLKAISNGILQMDRVFGIFYEVPLSRDEKDRLDVDDTIPEDVLELVVLRSEAKEKKDWEMADALRTRISELGFVVKDVKGGEPIVSKVE